MTDFIQMDIFFFITSVCALIILFFIVIVGIYLIVIIRKIKAIIKELEQFALYTTASGRESIDMAKDKIEEVLNQGGMIERIVATALGTILAKVFQKRGKMK